MNISDIALKRQVTTFMVFIAIVMIGAYSVSKLSIDFLPDIEFPTITVSTSYPGASPREVETLITEPIERAVSTVENVEEVRSSSGEGRSSVRISFAWGTDLTEAMDDLRGRIDRVKRILPEEADDPSIRKFDTSAIAIMYLGLAGDMPLDEVRKYADDEMRYKLERIKGVAAVSLVSFGKLVMTRQASVIAASVLTVQVLADLLPIDSWVNWFLNLFGAGTGAQQQYSAVREAQRIVTGAQGPPQPHVADQLEGML